MGMPVKLSDDLVRDAREEAKAADRSITAQIEHWAKLGRSVEYALRHEDVVALKIAEGKLEQAFSQPARRASIQTVLRRVADETDRTEVARKLSEDRTVYQSDPRGSGMIERIEPGGRRTIGRFENRRFVAQRRPARSRRG